MLGWILVKITFKMVFYWKLGRNNIFNQSERTSKIGPPQGKFEKLVK